MLDDIFSAMDTDRDGLLDRKDAKEAINTVNEMLGTQYSTEFLLESNKEFISYDEFLNEFADCFNLKIIDFAKNLVQ